MNAVLVVSPHLDDAVFSVGRFLAGRPGAIVVTMMAGAPDPPIVRTVWDKSCGFSTSQEAVKARRAEDQAAVAVLKATPVHLDFLDGQYAPANVGELADGLIAQVEQHRPEFVVGPLGVCHDDHVRVREAVLTADLEVPLWLYADLPYCVDYPQEAAAAVEAVQSLHYSLEPGSIGTGPVASKIEALGCYPSQMQHYDIDTLIVPERFWRVDRPW